MRQVVQISTEVVLQHHLTSRDYLVPFEGIPWQQVRTELTKLGKDMSLLYMHVQK